MLCIAGEALRSQWRAEAAGVAL